MPGSSPAELIAEVARTPLARRWPVPVMLAAWTSTRAAGAGDALTAAVAGTLARLDVRWLPSPTRRAIVVGTQPGPSRETRRFAREIATVGATLANPALFPLTVMNAPAGSAAIHHQCQGPNVTLCNGASAALDALAYGGDLIASGRADVVFAGGFESSADGTRESASDTIALVAALVAAEHPLLTRVRPIGRLLAVARHTVPAGTTEDAARMARAEGLALVEAGLTEARIGLMVDAPPPIDLSAGIADLEAALTRLTAETSAVLLSLAACAATRRRATAVVLANVAVS